MDGQEDVGMLLEFMRWQSFVAVTERVIELPHSDAACSAPYCIVGARLMLWAWQDVKWSPTTSQTVCCTIPVLAVQRI
jgi:hypothetical protein